jgi:hypothetical protein
MVEILKNRVGLALYHFLENIDGERHFHIIAYKKAQKLKILILIYLIRG